MTYYAVTNDPNELMHFGIKGMKWGVTRTPEQLGHHKTTKARTTRTAKPKENKPRSPAYQKASAKLSRAMRAGIAKAQANWAEYNSPYNKAQRQYNRALKRDERAYKRNEKAFQKHLQLAREGRLKYKGISDEEVGRITDRLALERSSRLLSGTEKQSFGRRLKERVGEGIIEGAGRGVSGYVSERMTARGRAIGEIKAERRKARAENSLIGRHYERLKENKLDRQSERQMEREADRINYLYKHNQQRKDTEKKAERDARELAETNYLAAIEENRALGYDRALESGSDAYNNVHGYSTKRRDIKRLSTAELKGRTAAIDEAARLYGKVGDARIKNLYGGKERQRLDENGRPMFDPDTGDPLMEIDYSGQKPSKPSKPSKSSNSASSNGGATVSPHPSASLNRSPNARTIMTAAHAIRSNKRNLNNSRTEAILDQERAQDEQQAAANRQWQIKQQDLARKQKEQKQARDEGFAYYAARRTSRENDPDDEYLPSAPTRSQVKADPSRYLPDLGKIHNSYAVTRARTRTDRATATPHPDASLNRPSTASSTTNDTEEYRGRHSPGYTVSRTKPETVSNTLGTGSQYSPSSSVTSTPEPFTFRTSEGLKRPGTVEQAQRQWDRSQARWAKLEAQRRQEWEKRMENEYRLRVRSREFQKRKKRQGRFTPIKVEEYY